MKSIYSKLVLVTLIFTVYCQTLLAAGADDFVIKVQTDNPGTSANNEFTIQTTGTGYNYNVDCDDDGTDEATSQTGNYVCSYANPGSYFIRIQDKNGDGTGFPRIYYDNTGDHRKLLDVIQWGTGKWTSMGFAFRGAINMTVTATDVPDLSNVTNLASMFRFATLANPDTSSWDVSNVTNMHSMFRSAAAANPDTSNWITTNVTTMAEMFRNATSANPDVSGWNITNVSNMSLMFANVTLPTVDYDAMLIHFANQNITNAVVFDGGNSQYCSIAAQNARAKLTNDFGWTITDGNLDPACPTSPLADFVIMVKTNNLGTSSNTQFTIPTNGAGYNYNVDCDDDNPGINIASGQTGNYTCDYVAAGTYTIRISDNVGNKTGFPRIYFNSELDYRKIIDLKQWGTGIWTNMAGAFFGASNMVVSATDVPDLSQVINTISMFSGADLANPNTTNWNVSNIQMMQSMFRDAVLANPDTSLWDTSSLTSTFSMFNGATSANPNVQSWDVTNVTNMSLMFEGVTLPLSDYDAMLNHFNSQSVILGITFSGGNSTYCNVAAHDGLENTHGWTITDGGLGPSCSGTPADDFVIEVDTTIAGSTSNIQFEINTTGAGYNYNVDCDGNNLGTNTATAQTGNYICNYVTPGVYTIRISDNIGDKTGFPRIYGFGHLDMRKIINLKQWGTGVWSSMSTSFVVSSNMVVTANDVPDLSNVASLSSMFAGASLANPNVSNWNTSNVEVMNSMFQSATSATPDISNWDITGLTVPDSMDLMLQGATIPTVLYDATLANFDSQITANGIVFHAGNSKYCNVAARDSLINKGWTINDGGLDPNCADSDIIFINGFEEIVVFKALERQFNYDFSKDIVGELDEKPLLIAVGLDDVQKSIVKIYLRNDIGQLQIRMDNYDNAQEIWFTGSWLSIDNTEFTTISW